MKRSGHAHDLAAAAPAVRRSRPGCERSSSMVLSRTALDELEQRAAADRIPRRTHRRSARRLRTRAPAWRPRLAAGSSACWRPRAGGLRLVRSGGEAAGQRRLRARAVGPGRNGQAGDGGRRRSRRPRLPRAGPGARRWRWRCFIWTVDGEPFGSRAGSSSSATRRYAAAALVQQATTAPADVQSECAAAARSCRTRCSRRCVMWRGRTSSPISVSFAQIYDRFGVPMPLMYPRASATLVDSAALRFLQKYKLPLEALQPQDESALNQLLEAQIPPASRIRSPSASHAIETRWRG